MAEPTDDEKKLDLEADAAAEMGHTTDCSSALEETVDALKPRLEEPHTSPRCATSEREVLKNQFPAE